MKILQVCQGYFPAIGRMEDHMRNMIERLARELEVTVFATDRQMAQLRAPAHSRIYSKGDSTPLMAIVLLSVCAMILGFIDHTNRVDRIVSVQERLRRYRCR